LAGPGIADPEPASEPGWLGRVYTYDANHPHAVAQIALNDESQSVVGQYAYDDNGNMTCRVENGDTFIQTYNADREAPPRGNRLSAVSLVDGMCDVHGNTLQHWEFTYDGDGSRVQQVYDDGTSTLTTAYFMGGLYEVTDGAVRKYYSIAGQRVAMQDGDGLKYLLTDHLGSILVIVDGSGITGALSVCLKAKDSKPMLQPQCAPPVV